MKIVLCYIAVTHGSITADYASRFVASYFSFPPGAEHDTLIICNGGPLKYETALIFSALNPRFYPRVNDPGYDISGYIDAAKGPCSEYDMMICCGESCYFHREGWLKRMVSTWQRNGPGMYGSFSSNLVNPHLNTTGFVCSPKLLSKYPRKVQCKADRYEFEHGKFPFWKFVASRGSPVKMVTWDGEWEPRSWRSPANILWRGDQSNCLMFCIHTDRYATAPTSIKTKWARGADRPFR